MLADQEVQFLLGEIIREAVLEALLEAEQLVEEGSGLEAEPSPDSITS